jgi:hypothetical protein
MNLNQQTENENQNKSTGPRTPEGKAIASRNSLKHGLASSQLIIPGEDPAAFEAMLAGYQDDFQPANSIEADLVYDLAKYRWLTDRALRLQSEAFANEAPLIPFNLGILIRYQNTHNRAFHTALKALQALQKERKKAEKEFVSPDDYIEPTFGPYEEPVDLENLTDEQFQRVLKHRKLA